MIWHIDLEKKTTTSINGIFFKLTEVEPDTFRWICTNPKDIPPDDLDDEILSKMVKEPMKGINGNYLRGGIVMSKEHEKISIEPVTS